MCTLLRCSPFVLDATKGDWESEVPFAEESLDCVLLIFTMVTDIILLIL